jgi:hypothetical protein
MVVEILFAKEDNQPLGHNWQAYFLERHPELKSKFVPPLNKERAIAQDPAVFQRYFDLFSTLVTIYKIDPADMYNMDEKGFMQGVIAKAKVIITREEHFKGKSYCIQDGNREWTSVIECMSTDGYKMAPWIIFKGVQCKKAWLQRLLLYHPLSHITMTYNGWTDNAIGVQWFRDCFIPESSARRKGEYILMLFDGHASHISSEVIRLCITHKVILLCLPPHTTHLLQPLDIGIFAALASFYKSLIRDTCKFGYNYSVDKLIFMEAYIKARDQAFTTINIQKAWAKAGLIPFLPSLIMSTLPPLPATSRPHTPLIIASKSEAETPFNILDVRRIYELNRTGQLQDPKVALEKMCKAAEINMASRITFENHNTEFQEAAARKKERSNRKGGNLAPEEARTYDGSTLEDRALWSHEMQEQELLARFMKYPLTIFDFKVKRARKKKVPPHLSKPSLYATTEPFENLTLLFNSPAKPVSPIKKVISPVKPIKATIAARVPRGKATKVVKETSKVVILTYGRTEEMANRIKAIWEIKSSSGRIIKPTAKRIVKKK